MAWEGFQIGAFRGVTGDEPFDLMSDALIRVRRSYLERFGRNPYFAELLHAMQATVEADRPSYVADAALPTPGRLVELVGAGTTFEHIDPAEYEAGIDEETHDFMVFPRAGPSKLTTKDSAVLRGQMIEQSGDNILCRYGILSPSLTDNMAKSLIRRCVLQDLMDRNLVDGNLKIQFERTS